MLILERPWTRQPQTAGIGLSALAISLGFDVFWSAIRPRHSLLGPQMLSSPSGAVFTEGIGISSGYAIVNGVVPSMHATTWTEVGVLHMDATNTVVSLSARTTGQACLFAPTGLSVICWNVASITIGGAIPVGTTKYVVRRLGSSHAFWRNGVQYGSNTDSSNPLATAGYLPSIGAQAGTGPYAGVGPLASTNGMLLVARTPLAIPDGLAAALSANPWQLFALQQIIIPTAAAAATAPTITALSAIGITATSAQPRISYS